MSRRPPSARDPQRVLFRVLPSLNRVVPGQTQVRAAQPLPRPLPPREATPTAGSGETVHAYNGGATLTLLDVSAATIHYVTLVANSTLTFPALRAGKSFTLVLVQDGTGSRSVTWPASVRWAGGTAPTLTTTASKRDVFSFLCADGSTYIGFVAGQNFS